MKALFLDIDGVVNCETTTERLKGYIGIDPVMAERVQRIIQMTNCYVVLSSTWRYHADTRKEVWDKVCHYYSVTPDLKTLDNRGAEVEAWLKDNNSEPIRYAILDDNDWLLPDQPLFKTEWPTGLTNGIADKVIAYLNGEAEYAAENRLRS